MCVRAPTEEQPVSVAALADLVLREPALAASMEDAKQGVTNLDLTGPAALPSVRRQGPG